MKSFIAAIQFITILPVGKPGAFEPKGMIQFFPVVGIIIGLLVSAFDIAVLQLWPKPVASLLDVIFLAIITGAFHLDGLADAADGLLGHRTREDALAVMKDSRIGVMGLVAVICMLAIKWGGIASLDVHRSLLLVIIPAYARGGLLFGIRFLKYGRPDGGTGHDFFSDTLKTSAFWGLLIPVALSFLIGWRGVLLNLIFIIITAVILLYYKKRIGCITGDMLGAMTEVLESTLFLMIIAGSALC
ncbi:MAG: adenosylcobinamide-GDP ribazoletransferase [Desulfobacteraceae bacterium]|nr:adenosylcobinamide-GDP ribazoletransferase [Pseudomonadota bacterium]MBU4462886.1 adenosylcobinamide-GDP ribazoletransferase [Pseudomonadota bacterium]MCG2755221.1 adenosylcobinamide-GDP ribazoletransferase [Desulfobacteraceae bacterium]NQT09650.1 adenosylcobinamide-GDP ribazoletransferase [Desulfobacteraceae bacterium]